MKRSAIVGVFFGLLLAISTVVGATTGAGTSKLERQTFQFRVGPVSTSSRAWRNIPGLRLDICAQHEESFVVSLNLSGAPVLIKI